MEITADNGPPFKSQEFKHYAVECGFSVRNITPAEPKVNGQTERFMKNIAKTVQFPTPHQTTSKSPAELMFPNRNFKTKVPMIKSVRPCHYDKEIRGQDEKRKQMMKLYADSKRYVKEHRVKIGDPVLVPRRKINKFTSPFRNEKYGVIKVKGSMITAQNRFGHVITRDASKLKRVQEDRNQGLEMDNDDDFSQSTEEFQKEEVKEKPNEIMKGAESQVIRRSNRVRTKTMNTKYQDFV